MSKEMVNDTGRNVNNSIIRQEYGPGTGDERFQTADGKWWVKYEGQEIGTGDEVRQLYR